MTDGVIAALIGLGGVALGSLSAGLTAILLKREERKRYRSERAWDQRREAYSHIVGKLDHAAAIANTIAVQALAPRPDKAWAEFMHAAQAQLREHMQAARETHHSFRLMTSDQFAQRVMELYETIEQQARMGLPPPVLAEQVNQLMRQGVADLHHLAAHELDI